MNNLKIYKEHKGAVYQTQITGDCLDGMIWKKRINLKIVCKTTAEMNTVEKRKKEIEIENMVNGNIAREAYWMAGRYGSSREWAQTQIERGIGDVADAAFFMCFHHGSSQKWAGEVTAKFSKKEAT